MLFSVQALMAREAVLKFNPEAKIVAHHGNVKEAQFGLSFVRKFDIVLNALDNVDARRYNSHMVCLYCSMCAERGEHW